ncbi:S8 family serine peptidase [Butyrivibrio sp. FC2001]|uniref:S8 family serine peptidase n=1 Tax=Butyrivibrio sp. FC2001 TaxID=1280671 RepID=UPI002100DE84|nr:S8 family serine peptidase [Butyrivibrio sp. FC2001]
MCNLSFSDYSYNIALKRTIENFNMLFIVSAGNDGIELDKENAIFPQSYDLDNVISVADMRCDGLLSKTSNFGVETIDIAAPGTDVSGKHMNETVSGTSFASANVTGIAAAIFCMNPTELAPQSLKKFW